MTLSYHSYFSIVLLTIQLLLNKSDLLIKLEGLDKTNKSKGLNRSLDIEDNFTRRKRNQPFSDCLLIKLYHLNTPQPSCKETLI